MKAHARAALLTVPALVAALLLPGEPSYEDMLFKGGPQIFLLNACLTVLVAYFAIFMLAIGWLVRPAPAPSERGLAEGDIRVLQLFGGAAILTIAGFALGLASLLRAWITIPIFCAVLYVYFLRGITVPALRSVATVSGSVGILIWSSIALVVAILLLTKGLLVNLYTSDVIQLYFPYLAEVRYQHGIWLDLGHPVISDFLIGRGNGVHLFAASFTSQFVIQLVSLLYLCGAAAVVHRIVYRFLPERSDGAWQRARHILPASAALLALCTPVLYIEFAKYHMQVGAFLLFLTWAGLLFLYARADDSRALLRLLLPVAVAVPLTLPQYAAFTTAILVVCFAAVAICRGLSASKPIGWLILAGFASALASLSFNQLYVGVGELNPPSLFLAFANLERFSRWSSVELVRYLGFAQDVRLTIPPLNLDTAVAVANELATLFSPFNRLGKPFPFDRADVSYPFRYLIPAALFALLFAGRALVAGRRFWHSAEWHRAGFTGRHAAFVAALLVVYVVGWFMTRSFHQGSIARVMEYQGLYQAFMPFLLISGLLTVAVWQDAAQPPFVRGARSTRVLIIGVTLVGLCSILLAARNLYAIDGGSQMRGTWKAQPVLEPVRRAMRYFVGRIGLVQANGPLSHWGVEGQWDFRRCMKVSRLVPDYASVLPLNAVFAIVPCQNSPLVARNKFVHHYQSVIAPFFGDLLFAPPQKAYEIYRRHRVDYFYIARRDIYFWGPGFSESFNVDNLLKYFEVHHEDADFFLLTWRGTGNAAVRPEIAAEIEELRHRARTEPGISEYWRGVLRLKDWLTSTESRH